METIGVTQNFVSRFNVRRVLDGMKRFAGGDAFPVLRRQTVELIRQWEEKRPELFSAADLLWAAAAENAMSQAEDGGGEEGRGRGPTARATKTEL